MPFIYRNLLVSPHDNEEMLPALLADRLSVPLVSLSDIRIIRKGIDARKKSHIKVVYTLSFVAADQFRARLAADPSIEWQEEQRVLAPAPVSSAQRIIIVGSGPAGLFAALRLAEYGLTATVIERGEAVEQRALSVQRFWKEGILDPESNVQFGEGGAGTFSDGKLTCRSKDPLASWVLEQLAAFGAQPEIRYLAKPHIGTDRLRSVVTAIRRELLMKGFTVRFSCKLTGMRITNGLVSAITVNECEEIPCDHLILASGHSARDTFEMLERLNVPLQRKPFAMGLRVEHPQELINRIQYGVHKFSALPVADYAVTWNSGSSGRSAYSFCMCPGGVVVGGASEAGGVVTNGMSGQLRNSRFANSALVVNVREDDFEGPGALGGIRLQHRWEQRAFELGGGRFHAPAQNLLDFLHLPGKGPATSSYRPGICETELDTVLPPFIIETLREGIINFGKKMKGFVTADATLIGIESRTSSPVRILRDSGFESVGIKRLYPAGEGAGYAGGIMSSAVDGIRIADSIAARLKVKG
ncbi:MAG: NAD(P)/FAD-dependent oxidoreductase [Desulfuromonadaceae bacterium]|nr:NAD(P)/FAD-dependent oxidoreductase [Desulfuromonadaceae bacterium]MDD5104003.1 NAD(P)/FAD-dependent oxidoreductase [Desulfuromonadaceae bacterium]